MGTKVLLSDIADALERPAEQHAGLDLATGEVHFRFDFDDGDDDDDGAFESLKPVPRLDSHESWEIMERFALAQPDAVLRASLLDSIEGRGAFRRFRDTLADWPDPDAERRWYAFQAEALEDYARDWLESLNAGLEIVEDEPAPPPPPKLVLVTAPAKPAPAKPPKPKKPKPKKPVRVGIFEILLLGAPGTAPEGRAARAVTLASEADAARVFADLCVNLGAMHRLSWTPGLFADRSTFEYDRWVIRVDGRTVTLESRVDPEVSRLLTTRT